MLNFFEKVINFFDILFDLMSNFIKGPVQAFHALTMSANVVTSIASQMPDFLWISFAVSIIILFLNFFFFKGNA